MTYQPIRPEYQRYNPGTELGIAGFVCALVFFPAGIILSWISRRRSKDAGMEPTGLATAGLVISLVPVAIFAIMAVLALLSFLVGLIRYGVAGFNNVFW